MTRQRRWAARDAGSVGPNDQRAVDNPTTRPLPERPPARAEPSARRKMSCALDTAAVGTLAGTAESAMPWCTGRH
jgi:hypothetical protein